MSDKQKLRDEYFNTFTIPDKEHGGLKKLNVAPHDLFEWFWKKLDQHYQEKINEEKLKYGKLLKYWRMAFIRRVYMKVTPKHKDWFVDVVRQTNKALEEIDEIEMEQILGDNNG